MPLEDTLSASLWPAAAARLGAPASFISAKDLVQGDKLFFGAGRMLRRGLATLSLLAGLGLMGAIALDVAGLRLGPASMFSFGAAALAFAGFWVLASLFRLRPARVCYMRPDLPLGGARFTHDLRPYGHVIAYRTASNGAGKAKLGVVARRLSHRFALNLRNLFTDRQTLSLNAAPELTQMLAQASDVLIVDLSAGAPRDWDLIQPQAKRCVFVSAWGQYEHAEAAFAALAAHGQCFYYAPDGEIQRRGQFRAAVLAAMRAAHGVGA